ncbi:MAG: IS4 family transposase [Dehalococcoidia bacterium]
MLPQEVAPDPASLTPAAQADLEPVVGEIETFVQTMIEQLAPTWEPREAHGPGSGNRVLPSLALWAGLLVCVLRGASSRLALWRLLREQGLWQYPRFRIGDQTVYDRLDRAGTGPVQQLFAQIRAVLAQRLTPYADQSLAPFASEVLALDETTLDKVARLLPPLRPLPDGDPRLLPGKLSALFDLRRQQWWRVVHQANPQQNEKLGAWEMLVGLPQRCLLLADLGYFGFAWFDAVTDLGHFWIARLREKTSYEVIHAYYQDGTTFDGLVWLGVYRADRAKHAVRLVQFQVGPHLYRYLTSVLDPQTLPLHEIARLYARRWDIELAFLLIKRHLGLALLWSAKEVSILQQVWAVLIISQILQALRLEIAGRAGVDPFEVSLALLVEYLPQSLARGEDPIAIFVARGRELGFIRPSTRTVVQAPHLRPDQLTPRPPGLVLERPPRYAGKCGRHPARARDQAKAG